MGSASQLEDGGNTNYDENEDPTDHTWHFFHGRGARMHQEQEQWCDSLALALHMAGHGLKLHQPREFDGYTDFGKFAQILDACVACKDSLWQPVAEGSLEGATLGRACVARS